MYVALPVVVHDLYFVPRSVALGALQVLGALLGLVDPYVTVAPATRTCLLDYHCYLRVRSNVMLSVYLGISQLQH
jgi:hypothetical protein